MIGQRPKSVYLAVAQLMIESESPKYVCIKLKWDIKNITYGNTAERLLDRRKFRTLIRFERPKF